MVLYNGHLNWKMGVVVLFGSSTPCQYFYYVYLFSLNMCHKSTKKRGGPLWMYYGCKPTSSILTKDGLCL